MSTHILNFGIAGFSFTLQPNYPLEQKIRICLYMTFDEPQIQRGCTKNDQNSYTSLFFFFFLSMLESALMYAWLLVTRISKESKCYCIFMLMTLITTHMAHTNSLHLKTYPL